jgi:hypothetical protein
MFNDFSVFLWLLKLGSILNIYFLAVTFTLPLTAVDSHILIPARILFAVSAYRCLFPVYYKDNIVFHDSPFSSIFLTRLFATFSEITFIYLFSHVLRIINVNHVEWVFTLSWLMVIQVVISQCFVWGAMLTRRLMLYFYEELGWVIIFAYNTIASAYLYLTVDTLGDMKILLRLNLLFGVVYLSWQFFNLRVLLADARQQSRQAVEGVDWKHVWEGLARSIRVKNQTRDARAWGGWIGLTWMIGYWATLIPMWVNQIVVVFSRR